MPFSVFTFRHLVLHADLQVVLQVFPHARQMMRHGNTMAFQLLAIAHPREL